MQKSITPNRKPKKPTRIKKNNFLKKIKDKARRRRRFTKRKI